MTKPEGSTDDPKNPVDVPPELLDLVEEIVNGIQAGETLDIAQFEQQHPRHAPFISDLLPTICELARNGSASATVSTAPNTNAVAPNVKRIGDYRILREIGRGGMGIVYEAEEESLRRRVALKVLPMSGLLDDRQVQRFQNEARAAAQLDHPNIVSVLSVGSDRGVYYYGMRYIEGMDLGDVIRDLRHIAHEKDRDRQIALSAAFSESSSSNASFPAGDLAQDVSERGFSRRGSFKCCTRIGIQVARALHYAHDVGIVHRDVKPSNLLLDHNGCVRLADFGLAQMKGQPGVSMTGDIVGTLRYMSPEQSLPDRVVVDHRTDVYSLGITLYELLTLRHAYHGGSPKEILRKISFEEPVPLRKLNPRIPTELQTIVSRAIARHPDERYQTAGDLADDLERFQNDQPIKAQPPSLSRRLAKWSLRHRGLVTAAAATMVMGLVTAVSAASLIWRAYEGESAERQKVEQLLERSEGLRLVAYSQNQVDQNPGLAMLLAIEGANRHHGPEANDALLIALDANHEHRTLIGHSTQVGQAHFSPDGARVVTTATASIQLDPPEPARVWDAESGELLHTLNDATRITSAAFSPGGGTIVTTSSPPAILASDDREADRSTRPPSVWDLASGQKRFSLPDAFLFDAHPGSFSPDGRRLVTPGFGKTARIFRTANGEEEFTLRGHDRRITFATFSPDGTMIATVSDDDSVRIWDSGDGHELLKLEWKDALRNQPEIESLQFSPDNRRLATGSVNYGVELWDVETGKRASDQFLKGSKVLFSPDGDYFLAWRRSSLSVCEAETTRVVRRISDMPGDIRSVSLNAIGDQIVVSGDTMETSLWNVHSGNRLASLRGHDGTVNSAKFNHDGQRVVTASSDGTARIWHIQSGRQRARIDAEIHSTSRPLLVFSKDSQKLVVPTRTVYGTTVWNPDSMEQVQSIPGRLYAADHVGDRLLTRVDSKLVVWDLAESQQVASTNVSEGEIRNVWLGPREEVALVICKKGPVFAWNTITNQKTFMRTDGVEARHAAFHPDGRQIALTFVDGRVVLCDVQTGELQTTFAHPTPVTSVRFSPNGKRLLTVTDRNTATMRDLTKTQPIPEFVIDDGLFNRSRFSSDGRRFFTFKPYDGDSVCCRDSATGALIQRIEVAGLIRVAENPVQPQVAISSGRDGAIIWNYETGISRKLDAGGGGSVTFSGDGSRVIFSSVEHLESPEPTNDSTQFARPVVQIWSTANGERLVRHQMPRMTRIVRAHRIKNLLVTSGQSFGAAIVDTQSNRTVRTLSGHAGPISFVGLTADRRKIITASSDHTAAIRDLDGVNALILDRHSDAITHATIAPAGDLLATGDGSGQCLLWNMDDGRFVAELAGHTGKIDFMTFDREGDRLLTAARDGSVRLWDIATRESSVLDRSIGAFFAEFSPVASGLLIVPGAQAPEDVGADEDSLDGIMRKTPEARPGQMVQVFAQVGGQAVELAHSAPVSVARYALDGTRVVTLTAKGEVTLWDARSGEQLVSVQPGGRPVHTLSVSRDGKSMLLQEPTAAYLWDLTTGKRTMTLTTEAGFLQASPSGIRDMYPFSPDGSSVVTVRRDGSLRAWTRRPLQQAKASAPRLLTPKELQRFQVQLSPAP